MEKMNLRYNRYAHAVLLVYVNRLDVSRIGDILMRASEQLPMGLFDRLVKNYVEYYYA